MPPPNEPRCCVPELIWAQRLSETRTQSQLRARAVDGSIEEMVKLDGGVFLMGSDSPETFPEDGEGPVRQVRLSPYYIAKYAVTNEQFSRFVKATGYLTDAQKIGWSFVFQRDAPPHSPSVEKTPWWRVVKGATWSKPEGPGSHVRNRQDHPVVHVSHNDASAYCGWAGYRLPTEAEWEHAARAGLTGKLYPWGDELTPGGIYLCNIWQGKFPDRDEGHDGYAGRAPVHSFPPNGFGLHNMTGNVWEWVYDWFSAAWHRTASMVDPVGPPQGLARVIRGGSFLCHASYCNRYRNSARSANTPDSSTGNMGFRVVRDVN